MVPVKMVPTKGSQVDKNMDKARPIVVHRYESLSCFVVFVHYSHITIIVIAAIIKMGWIYCSEL